MWIDCHRQRRVCLSINKENLCNSVFRRRQILFFWSRAEQMCLFAPADVHKHITAGANKLCFKPFYSFNEERLMFRPPPSWKPPSPKCKQICWALTKCLALRAHTPAHKQSKQFSNMLLNGPTKYSLRFHKSCKRRSCVLPAPATGDKSALCALSGLTDHQAIPPLD